jgi:hypothetical protein
MPAKLVDMAVSNNILVVALDTFRLLRIDLDNPLEVEGNKREQCFKRRKGRVSQNSLL